MKGNAEALGGKDPKRRQGLDNWVYLVTLCTISVAICYADRSNISTAMLPMSEMYHWDRELEGRIFSSFFLGYAATQVAGGQLADRIGGKSVLLLGVVLWSVFTFATPSAAAFGLPTLIAARVMLGLGEGVAFPAIHSLISRNVPPAHQSTAVGAVTAASYAGTAVAFALSPMLVSNVGWEYVYYLFGGSAVVWIPFWILVEAKSTYMGHDYTVLKDEETAASEQNSSDSSERPEGETVAGPAQAEVGFWALMKRKEVWAICICQYTQSWGMYGLLTWLPTFFTDYYHVELGDLGGYTMLPYIVQGSVGLSAGFIADKLLQQKYSVRNVRTGMQVIGMIGPGACLMLALSPWVGADPRMASTIITVGLGLSALTLGGVSASQLDIAPRHAGAIFGAGNTAATLAGFVSAASTGWLLEKTDSWLLVFGIIASHYLVGSIVWTLWMGDRPLPEDGEEQVGGPSMGTTT